MRALIAILLFVFGFGATASAQESAKPFIYFTADPVFASGSVAPGGTLVTGEVKHGLTGILSSDVHTAAWFNTQGSLPVGTPVYGVPVENNEIMWCAPIKRRNGWRARCMVPNGTGAYSLDNLAPAFAILYVVYEVGATRTPTGATAPAVERRDDVSFGAPLRLELRFDGWRNNEARMSINIGPNGEPGGGEERRFNKGPDGSVMLTFGSDSFRVSPDPNNPANAVISVLSAPHQGDISILMPAELQTSRH